MSTNKHIQLTESQIKAIVEIFFIESLQKIGRILLEKGSCIASGDPLYRMGGIANFITTTKPNHFIGCVNYTIDLQTFFSSLYFKEVWDNFVRDSKEKLEHLEEETKQYAQLLKYRNGIK